MSIGRIGDSAEPVRVRVPAKINLGLTVGELRPDGFHELRTIFHAVDLYDEVTVRPASRWSVRIVGYPDLPKGLKNLAGKAAKALQEQVKNLGVGESRPDPVAIEIHKQIPVAGGMAGGSADAAAALVACNALWRADLDREDLAEVGARIGSDVPFALYGGTAIGAGRGELLSPVLTRMTLHWVLALADGGLSTPEVFAELDRMRAGGHSSGGQDTEIMVAALRSGSVTDVADALSNDLQDAALSLNPGLARTIAAGTEAGALGAIVSGSGPTVALLCSDADHSADVAARMTASGVCLAVKIATGPALGARLVQAMS